MKELQDLFWEEAEKYSVLPLQTSFADRVDPAIRPSLTRGRDKFTYYQGMTRIPEGSTPDLKNKSYVISVEVEIPKGGASGVLATQGGGFGGWGLLVLDGKPVFVHALSNQKKHKYPIAAPQRLTPGKHTIRFEFTYDGGGIGKGGVGTLLVDGKQVAQGRIEQTVRARFSLDETFDVGADTGTAVIEKSPSRGPLQAASASGARHRGPAGPPDAGRSLAEDGLARQAMGPRVFRYYYAKPHRREEKFVTGEDRNSNPGRR